MNLNLLIWLRQTDLRHQVWIELLCVLLSGIVLHWNELCLLIWNLNERLLDHRLQDLRYLYYIIQVAVVILDLKLIFSASPLPIDNELILMTTGIQFDHQVELSFINSLHWHLLPVSKRSRYVQIIASITPSEKMLRLFWLQHKLLVDHLLLLGQLIQHLRVLINALRRNVYLRLSFLRKRRLSEMITLDFSI